MNTWKIIIAIIAQLVALIMAARFGYRLGLKDGVNMVTRTMRDVADRMANKYKENQDA
jgi:hypothetical protein